MFDLLLSKNVLVGLFFEGHAIALDHVWLDQVRLTGCFLLQNFRFDTFFSYPTPFHDSHREEISSKAVLVCPDGFRPIARMTKPFEDDLFWLKERDLSASSC